jgi:hypothetical protein
MSVVAWLGVVSAIVSILAFMFAIWVWLRSDIKVRELEGVIRAAHDVAGTIQWEMQTVRVDDPAARLRSTERSLGEVYALRAITAQYVKGPVVRPGPEFGGLMERGVIWSTSMLWDIETADRTRDIWFVTPDLEPDISDPTVASVVSANLKRGKRYIYFCPANILHRETTKTKLLASIGALKSDRLAARVTIVPVEDTQGQIFQRGNVIIFFFENADWETGRAFEEIVFTKLSARGLFWQEYPAAVAEQIKVRLKQELDSWQGRA